MPPLGLLAAIALQTLVGLSCLPQAPEVRIVDSEPVFPDCLSLRPKVTLGDVEDSISLGGLPKVLRTAFGYFAVSFVDHPSNILLYGSDGNLLRDLGRYGSGPGEVRLVRYLAHARGDSVIVAEEGSRVHLFSGEGHFGRTVNVRTTGKTAVQFPDGSLVVGGQVLQRSTAGIPVHFFNASGDYVRSFGGDVSYRRDQPLSDESRLALASDTSVWLVRPDTYRLEEWSRTGNLLRAVSRSIDWFPPLGGRSFETGYGPRPPDPYITAVYVEEGLLWVVSAVPDPDRVPPRVSAPEVTPFFLGQTYDSVVEVLDPNAGRLLARLRTGLYLAGSPAPREVHTIREDSIGMRYLDIWELTRCQELG